jgi:membrane protease YdiL (CAAX protease family)
MDKNFAWRLFGVLSGGCVLGWLLVIPYLLWLKSPTYSLSYLITHYLWWQVLLNAGIFAVCTAVGLYFARVLGLRIPFLSNWLYGEPIRENFKKVVMTAVGWGIVSGVVTVGLISGASLWLNPWKIFFIRFNPAWWAAAWRGFFASFYGAVNEEVFARLFVMGFFAWVWYKIRYNTLSSDGAWAAIAVAAALFALGHVPMACALNVSSVYLALTFLGNMFCGVIFGWLYYTRGLETAIIAHFTADIVLHVLAPIIVVV